ncbi:MAG TPA: zinc ribbon domain-containing protein [Syntrophales bacterium]|jgi:putative FmdB family regulatory protein|nr:zinc ribbon domain-containing protein [Syntrophales bacterium]HPX55011.1 zinc ribbon domain-containing protein [Syntrophales bacterium]HQA82825.1 zinc ribbon domain-containing protein [Syntrophales bacterium]
MPIYEYKCQQCGKEFEEFQGITEPAITQCRFCRGPVSKLLSLSSFHLKGSGWYVTDYGGKKPSTRESKKEKTEKTASAEKAGPSKTDT